MKYESWTERTVREAIERGEFDNLRGAGKPIPGINGREDENWWVKSFLEREQLPMPLPTTLAVRRELADLQETLADVGDEATVRQIVRDLNRRIVDAHRNPDGPSLVLKMVNVETRWHSGEHPGRAESLRHLTDCLPALRALPAGARASS